MKKINDDKKDKYKLIKRLFKILDPLFFIWRFWILFLRWSARHWQSIATFGSLGAAMWAYSISNTTEGKVEDIDVRLASIQESITNLEPQEVEKVVEVVVEVPVEVEKEVIVEVIKEVTLVKEVEVIKEVEVEKVVDNEIIIIKEVEVEVIVEVPVEVLPQELVDLLGQIIRIETYADIWDGDPIHGGFEADTDDLKARYQNIINQYQQ